MKFSIIIPTYNNSEYLIDCLNSIILQDYNSDEFEIIVVDDASTEDISDTCNSIYNDVLTKFNITNPPSLKIIRHNLNKRQGGARNTGLQNAKGEYVIFLDSDDYWNGTNVLSALEPLVKDSKYDVIRSVTWNNAPYDQPLNFAPVNYNGVIQELTGKGYIGSTKFFYDIWTSVYKRSLLIANKISFRENVVYEDSDWTLKVFWETANVALINFPFYTHRLNPESTAMKPRIQSFKDNISSIACVEDFIVDSNMEEPYNRICYNRIKHSIMSYILMTRHYSINESVDSLKTIRKNLLTQTHNYDMTASDKIKFFLIRNCPFLLVSSIKFMTISKRFILKCVQK